MYRALYRKWRPQRFEDVVGQRAIVAALKNQVAAGRVGHAYLFTGVRGTGKTTCAKIFAKAVNCLDPQIFGEANYHENIPDPPQGSPALGERQLTALAKILAQVVLPVPRVPVKM